MAANKPAVAEMRFAVKRIYFIMDWEAAIQEKGPFFSKCIYGHNDQRYKDNTVPTLYKLLLMMVV